MNLFSDLEKIVKQHLTTIGVPIPAAPDIEALMLLALNHEMKAVSQQPRTVHCSKEFSAKRSGLPLAQKEAVGCIFEKLEKGEDVNGHLSRSSAKPAETDPLLADWKIHHLHISNHKEKPGDSFFARTGLVMFAHVAPADVYFIDIYPHGGAFPEAWTRQALPKIIDDNWPHLLDPYRIKGITDTTFTPSDLDLKQLRGGQLNTIVQVGSSFIAPPGGGLASDGTPATNVARMHMTFRLVNRLEAWVNANSAKLKAEIASKNTVPEAELDFELVPFNPNGWGVIEKKTQTLVARSS